MQSAILPANESLRLKALHDLHILDTPPEAIFDDITELASQICKAPIVLVSLVDENRQWFKSAHGLDVRETSRDLAFCGHAILQDDIFEIEDSFNDPRFFDNPLAMGAPHVRFYAAMPLKTMDGFNVGTLCAIDKEPRRLDESQKRALKILAQQVTAQLELKKITANQTRETASSTPEHFHTQALHLKVLADLCLSEFSKGNLEKVQEILNKISHNSPEDSKRVSGL